MQQPAVPNGRHRLPAHLIVLFDSISNADFMSLTKRSLRDKVDALKHAVAAELVKRTEAAGGQRTADPPLRSSDRPVPRTHSPDPQKSQPKAVRTADRPSDRTRDSDRGQLLRNKQGTGSKNAGPKSGQTAVPPPPKFSDLIRLATDRSQTDDTSGSESPPVSSSARKTPAASRRPSPDSRRRHTEHRNSDQRPDSRARPSDQQREANRQVDRRPQSASGIPSRGRIQESDSDSRNRRPVATSRQMTTSRTAPNPSSSGNSTVRNGMKTSDSRKSTDKQENGHSDRRIDEKKLSAKGRKKDENDRMLELRKQRIRDEEARVKLRNDVLAGKKNSADLKTLVTKSQGSTVLSCGRPATHSDPSARRERPPPDRSQQNRPSDRTDQRRGPMPPGRDPYDRYRPTTTRDAYGRPSDRYYNDYEDDDEDEEMDDFIDDDDNNFIDDGDVPDVSQHIREIFGYDKRKYADFDDDDIEESSYAQVQKEEMRSAKIGRKEDLEDMKMELMKKKEKRRLLDRS